MALAGTGAELAHLTPRPTAALFADNYLSTFDFSTQFLPEVYEQEVERYGKRTVSGFLRMVGAEIPAASDQIIWSEQTRLHIAFNPGVGTGGTTHVDSGTQITLPTAHGIQIGDTLVVNDYAGNTARVRVSASGATTLTVQCYDFDDLVTGSGITANDNVRLFVYGTEYSKGSSETNRSLDANFERYTNKMVILRDRYAVNGSDASQIGWVEVTTEAGTTGYMWYLKSEHETRLRFEDYLESAMLEGVLTVADSEVADNLSPAVTTGLGASDAGTQGLFASVEARGIVYNDADFDDGSGLLEFDSILQELDKQGAIEENMLYLNRATALSMDNMLANLNPHTTGGLGFGVFNNEEQMALNLGFTGFRRGSYDFYKTDWKYLNDPTRRGLFGDIEGLLIPAGTTSVYDEMMGKNIRRPFLHVRYRASEADDRRMKSWVTGSVGGNFTSTEDAMNVNYLSERCLCTMAANNFVLFKNSTS